MTMHTPSSLSDGIDHNLKPMFAKAAEQADALLHRGTEAIRHTTDQLRDQAAHSNELMLNYIKKEPVKSVLVAAAAGALIMTLVSLAGRGRG